MGILPRNWRGETLYYRFMNKFIMVMLALLALSITFDLQEASQDILQFGDDLVVLIGVYMILIYLILIFC